jgi:hypothetical protein
MKRNIEKYLNLPYDPKKLENCIDEITSSNYKIIFRWINWIEFGIKLVINEKK